MLRSEWVELVARQLREAERHRSEACAHEKAFDECNEAAGKLCTEAAQEVAGLGIDLTEYADGIYQEADSRA